jgi:hypothetical protein
MINSYPSPQELLWQHFQKRVLAGCTDGLAFWYKDELVRDALVEQPVVPTVPEDEEVKP